MEIRDFTTIISVVIALVTVIYTKINNDKTHQISIITKQRLKKYNDLQEIAANFICASECYLKFDDVKYEIEIRKARSKLITLLNYGFKRDKQILDLVAIIVDKVEHRIDYIEELAVLIRILDVYLYTEWYRIKAETSKQNISSLDKWEATFLEAWQYNEKMHQSTKYNVEIFNEDNDYHLRRGE